MRMNLSVTGNVIAGVIAAVIFFVISLLTGSGFDGPLLLNSLILGVVTFLISLVVTRIIAARKRDQRSV